MRSFSKKIMRTTGGSVLEEKDILRALKKAFVAAIPAKDKRTGIPHLEFVTGLVFCFFGDSKTFALEAIRRFVISTFGKEISKGAFWERLSRKRLNDILKKLIAQLVSELPAAALFGADILIRLGVSAVLLIDSSSITLWDGAADEYPGTRTNAGIKWHACFDILTGVMTWFDTTPTSVNDRRRFPDVRTLAGKLVIFDLGYWDYGLLISIDTAEGFFLSRVKTNTSIIVKDVIEGISRRHIGTRLSLLSFKRRVGEIAELLVDVTANGEKREFRAIGFWNSAEKKYHWYVTNLEVPASIIYPLYKIRWQLELIFKGCKRSFNLNEKPVSNNDNIIESLILTSIIASLASVVVLKIGRDELDEERQTAVSFQRVCMVTALLSRHFIDYLAKPSRKYLYALADQIKLLAIEIFEKNFRKRPTTMQRLGNELEKSL
jgi:hypothetical protein